MLNLYQLVILYHAGGVSPHANHTKALPTTKIHYYSCQVCGLTHIHM